MLTRIPLAQVHAGDNDRTTFDPEALASLAASIEGVGLAQPIVVRSVDNGYRIIAGERRFRAMSMLGWETTEAIVRDDLSAPAEHSIMMAENLARVNLDVVDEARAYRSHMDDTGATLAETAKAAGVTVARIASRLPVLDLCPEGQRLARTGSLSTVHAAVLAKLDNDRQVAALRQLSTRDLTYFEFRDLCEKMLTDQNQQAMFDLELAAETYAAEAVEGRRRCSRAELVDLVRKLTAACNDEDLAALALDAIVNEKGN